MLRPSLKAVFRPSLSKSFLVISLVKNVRVLCFITPFLKMILNLPSVIKFLKSFGESLPPENILYTTPSSSHSACGSVTAGSPVVPRPCSLLLKMLCGFSLLCPAELSLRPSVCEFIAASPAVQKPCLVQLSGVCPVSTGVEHQHVRVCADPERAQARHRLPAVPGPARGQWLLGQHHQVGATSCWS